MKTLVIATCVLAFGLPSFGAASDGLVAHYKFDGNADDSSANKNNGVVQGATLTADRFGNANRAYSFNGESWIEVANSVSLQSVTNTMTFSAWHKPTRFGGWFPLLCKGVAKRQFGFEFCNDDIFINDFMGTGNKKEVRVKLPFGACGMNIWYHVAASYDGKTMKAYINGKCVGSTAVADGYSANTSALYIGMDPPGGADYMCGSLDEIRIYNRTLSDKEMADIYMQESRNR